MEGNRIPIFLLYCGPIVLKNIRSKRLYKHFLLFHSACRILCTNEICVRLNQFAKEFLFAFVKGLVSFYGEESLTINPNHLLHMADGLGKLKNKLRSPLKPYAQICRRLFEESSVLQQKWR